MKLPVRYDLCVCASKGRAGHEATEVADWIGYLPNMATSIRTPTSWRIR